jgi:hypothetical protein
MHFKLGAALVKGGKVIAVGYNHHRTHYDGADARVRGPGRPVSMHAEMHAIFSVTGSSPSPKQQVQGAQRGPPARCETGPSAAAGGATGGASAVGCACTAGAPGGCGWHLSGARAP